MKRIRKARKCSPDAVALKIATETFTNNVGAIFTIQLKVPNMTMNFTPRTLSFVDDLFRIGFQEPTSNKFHIGRHGDMMAMVRDLVTLSSTR
jgi:hypothetical protein